MYYIMLIYKNNIETRKTYRIEEWDKVVKEFNEIIIDEKVSGCTVMYTKEDFSQRICLAYVNPQFN